MAMVTIQDAARGACRAWFGADDVTLAMGVLADALAEYDEGATDGDKAEDEGEAATIRTAERRAIQAGE